MSRRDRVQLMLVRIIWICVLVLLHELILLIYQYFNTAVFEWVYVRDMLLRVALTTALCLIAYNPYHALCFGRMRASNSGRNTREVKNF